MKKHTAPLEENKFYHIYNCGINGGQLFFDVGNYAYLRRLMTEKISPVAVIYCFLFLPAHFHILVKTRSKLEIAENLPNKSDYPVEEVVSQQFANTFNSYTQAVNKRYGRSGKLMELPFRRRCIESDEQLKKTILYIICNPVKHGVCANPLNYPHSSVADVLEDVNVFSNGRAIAELFGGVGQFKKEVSDYSALIKRC